MISQLKAWKVKKLFFLLVSALKDAGAAIGLNELPLRDPSTAIRSTLIFQNPTLALTRDRLTFEYAKFFITS